MADPGSNLKESSATVTSTPFDGGPIYQVVSSHGNEAVPGHVLPVVVQHSPMEARIRPIQNSSKGVVNIPIHNPQTTVATNRLHDIHVKFESHDGATVENTTVHFDNVAVFHKSKLQQKGTFDLSISSSEVITYDVLNGINLSLFIKFPSPDSYIRLYSVSLVFVA